MTLTPHIPRDGDDSAARDDADGRRTDEQLLLDHRNGTAEAFRELIGRYERELYHFLVRFTGDRAAAEDVFQESFLQVHQSMHTFDTSRRFKPWLFTIAANKARDYLRSAARKQTAPLQAAIGSDDEGGSYLDLLEGASPQPAETITDAETSERVRQTVDGLPDHLREILLLSYFQQFPYRTIAEMLDIPLGTVKSRLHAAVLQFGERWKALNRRAD